jgi:hypothetical protein
VDRIDALITETGQTGFHFVDEAAPPARLVDLAIALLERGRAISWWGNIRFEAAFTADVCRLLAASGCIAVSGGLETASDRLLALMDKGVTVAQAARTAHHLTRAGIMVHAYLMYAFPTETPQETMDALERVRQFFEEDLIQSGFWHRFTATVHSPVGRSPEAFGISIDPLPAGAFARNDLTHRDPRSGDLDALGRGLARAVYHYMHGMGLDDDVRKWFDARMPRPKVPRSAVRRALASMEPTATDPAFRLVWIGKRVEVVRSGTGGRSGLVVYGRRWSARVPLRKPILDWLAEWIMVASPKNRKDRPYPTLGDLAATFPGPGSFAAWSQGRAWRGLRRAGLLIV